MSQSSAALGRLAEQQAGLLVQKNGYRIIERNYRCRLGELDIIALKEQQLVFIEVRHRSKPQFGSGLESVDPHKQQRLIAAAQHFLSRGKYPHHHCRFDIISSRPGGDGKLDLQWLENAFQAY